MLWQISTNIERPEGHRNIPEHRTSTWKSDEEWTPNEEMRDSNTRLLYIQMIIVHAAHLETTQMIFHQTSRDVPSMGLLQRHTT